jgi:hypothetical protein
MIGEAARDLHAKLVRQGRTAHAQKRRRCGAPKYQTTPSLVLFFHRVSTEIAESGRKSRSNILETGAIIGPFKNNRKAANNWFCF